MLKGGLNRGLQVIASLAVSSAIFVGGQEVAMAGSAPIGMSSIFDGFNSLLGIAVVGGMQNATINVSNMNNEVITSHLSATNMDRKSTEQKIWAQYIHNNSRVDNTVFYITSSFLPSSSLVSYNNEVNGLIIGTDFISKENKYLGIAFNYGEGYVDNKGDMAITRNDYDYWGMSFYENWKLGKINVMADLGYMKNSGKIKQTNMLIGTELNANVDSNVLTAGVRSEFITNIRG